MQLLSGPANPATDFGEGARLDQSQNKPVVYHIVRLLEDLRLGPSQSPTPGSAQRNYEDRQTRRARRATADFPHTNAPASRPDPLTSSVPTGSHLPVLGPTNGGFTDGRRRSRRSDQGRWSEPRAATTRTRTLDDGSDLPFDSRDYGYPAHIRAALNTVHEVSAWHPEAYHELWHQVLGFWFPRSSGYAIEAEWSIARSRPVAFAVLYGGDPVVLVDLQTRSSVGGSSSSSSSIGDGSFAGSTGRRGVALVDDDRAKVVLRDRANGVFDQVAVWSGQPALCVLSVVGTTWNAFVRPTDMTSEEVGVVVGYDWYGEWNQDVGSRASFEALKSFFGLVKQSVTRIGARAA